jgi:glycerophosphoryl diester phosphodiesterase
MVFEPPKAYPVPQKLSFSLDNINKMAFCFVLFSLIRTLTMSKVLSLDNKNKMRAFCFVLFSLIRTFVGDMEVIEQSCIAKDPKGKGEDGLVVTPDFIAVIDGSTSKSDYRHSRWRTNGRQAMKIVARHISRMPKETTLEKFLTGVTAAIRSHYKRRMLPQLQEHPEDRLTCSVVVYSRLCREIWMVGDCQCLVDGELYDNPKPYEAELAALRAEEVRRQLAAGRTQDELLDNDTARPVIIPRMLETMREQNVTYSVVDGFYIPRQLVRTVTLDFRPWEIVLASDGYPFLCPTLAESEQRLSRQHEEDPLNIGTFQATKCFRPGFNGFDDRTFIRFRV